MKDLKNEIINCLKESEYDSLKALENINSWLKKAKEELQYGDVNDTITITLTILEEISSGKESIVSLRNEERNEIEECKNKALSIADEILKTPYIRSDVKLLLDYQLKQIC